MKEVFLITNWKGEFLNAIGGFGISTFATDFETYDAAKERIKTLPKETFYQIQKYFVNK
jgi:hypothetical protein